MNTLFICPVCSSALDMKEKTYKCEQGHSFDISREGYVNLLPANRKKSKSPGDTKEMLEARSSFLSKNYYDFLTVTMVDHINKIATNRQRLTLLDSGCGDGHFICSIYNQLKKNLTLEIDATGTDISKPALKIAARESKNINWGVASSFRLPIRDNSVDILIRMFAPGDNAEVVRVLKADGHLITVTPGPMHLFGLKEVVYNSPRPHNRPKPALEQMIEINEVNVKETINITDNTDLKNLLTMTPYYWNGDREVKEKFDLLTELTTQVDFIITIYKKINL